jgi:hypothetical protein
METVPQDAGLQCSALLLRFRQVSVDPAQIAHPFSGASIGVPADRRLEAEAMISNRDSGFVSVGQQAEVKIDTFNFTRYGLLQGKVVSVSQDAIVRDKPGAQAGADDPGCGTENRKRSVFWYFVFLILTAGACLIVCPFVAVAADQLTADEIGKLEPEICKQGSDSFRALTGVFPTLAGSSTRDMTPEQIALIDQSKASGRRKVWILKVPAAFITFRTCDSGRQNWIGEGDDLKVGQYYDLDMLLLDDRAIARTRATNDEKNSGIAVKISLNNRVRDPQKLHGTYEGRSWVIGRAAVNGPPTCHEQPSNIAGLVEFKRINPNVGPPSDCGRKQHGVFARKSGEGQYDFVMYCEVNCRVYRDYEGWSVEYSYSFRYLENWESIHDRIKKMLDEWTLHIDRDS